MGMSADPVVDADAAAVAAAAVDWQRLAGAQVLITGASGMIGSYTVLALLAANDAHGLGMTVRALVRDHGRAAAALGPALERPDLRLVTGDVTALPGGLSADVVVHAASAAQPASHLGDPVGTFRANVVGTLDLLELARRAPGGCRGFVFTSSAEVYGEQPDDVALIPEDSYGGFDHLRPRASYSEGKRAGEAACAAYAAQYGLPVRIARLGHIYGPQMAVDDGRVQADFAAKAARGEDIVLNSDGSAVRTYTYVGDAVAGMIWMLLAGDELVYNVADPDGLVSIRQLAEAFCRVRADAGLTVRFAQPVDPTRYAAATRQGLDSSRLAALGWRPQVPLAEGLARMVASVRRRLDPSPDPVS